MNDKWAGRLLEVWLNLRLADVLDVAIVAVCLYVVIVWLRWRASRSVVVATAAVGLLYVLARWLTLSLTLTFFRIGFTVIAVGLILVYQEDLRWACEHLLGWGLYPRGHRPSRKDRMIDIVIESVSNLAERRIGALLVFKGRQPLERRLRGGVHLDGHLSVRLLLSLFEPHSPGHDGAVVIDHERVERFAVHLPLSGNLAQVGQHGTRHAAAVGLTENSDALVIVISEETGITSVARDGSLLEGLSLMQLRDELAAHSRIRSAATHELRRRRWRVGDLASKLLAFSLAGLLWFAFSFQRETVTRSLVAPIEYRNLPEGLTLLKPGPTEARITLSAPQSVHELLKSESLVVSIDVGELGEGLHQVVVGEENLNLPAGTRLSAITPRELTVEIDRMVSARLPVRVQFRGALAAGLEIAEARAEPDEVTVQIPSSARSRITAIPTESWDLSAISQSTSQLLRLMIPEQARIAAGAPHEVRVHLRIASNPGSSAAGAGDTGMWRPWPPLRRRRVMEFS